MQSEVKYGKEHGLNLIKIAKRLLGNQNLCKLLVNTDLDPLSPMKHPDKIDGLSLLHNNVKVIPFIDAKNETTQSKIVLLYEESNISDKNPDNENLSFIINVYCPFKEWLIVGDSLRPFSIMSEIRESIQDKRLNGLGEIRYEGFSVSSLTDEMSSYTMRFFINAFS